MCAANGPDARGFHVNGSKTKMDALHYYYYQYKRVLNA